MGWFKKAAITADFDAYYQVKGCGALDNRQWTCDELIKAAQDRVFVNRPTEIIYRTVTTETCTGEFDDFLNELYKT